MSIRNYVDPRNPSFQTESRYAEYLDELTGKLYVSVESLKDELEYAIEEDGKISSILIAIGPEIDGDATYYGELSIDNWLEKVFSTFDRPGVHLEVHVAECTHELHIEDGCSTVAEACSILCEALAHLIRNAPFPIVFEPFDGEHGFDRTMFPCINGTPKMKYPQDTEDAEDAEDIEIDEPEEDEDIAPTVQDGKPSDSLKMTYQVALAAYPKETQELLKTLRSSRSKNKDTDPNNCTFNIRMTRRISGMSVYDLFAEIGKTPIKKSIESEVEEFKNSASAYLEISVGKYTSSVNLKELPQVLVDNYRKSLEKEEEEREAYDALSPEEKEDRFNKNIAALQGYGGFMMIGGTPNFKNNQPKDKIIHNSDNTISMQKADGTVEVIGSVESIGRGQYFGTFGDLDDFPFESLDSAIYWIEDCYRSKNGDGQLYKFQQAIKRRRDKGIEF